MLTPNVKPLHLRGTAHPAVPTMAEFWSWTDRQRADFNRRYATAHPNGETR